jgi:hypothetical protein
LRAGPYGLRGQACVRERQEAEAGLARVVEHDEAEIRVPVDVALTEDADSVERVVCPSVPELPHVEDGVDGRGRVARLGLACGEAAAVGTRDVENVGVDIATALRPVLVDALKDRCEGPHRAHGIIGVAPDRRVAVRLVL